jgi:hypothetical protein
VERLSSTVGETDLFICWSLGRVHRLRR